MSTPTPTSPSPPEFAKSREATRGPGHVTLAHSIPGTILFIKKPSQILHADFLASGMPLGGLRHPALVLSHATSLPSHVTVCPLTSNASRPLPRRSPRRASYLPIAPLPPLTPRGPVLHTEGEPLRKLGYLNASRTYTLHTDMLRAYDSQKPAGAFRVSPASLAVVRRKLGERVGAAAPEDTVTAARVPERGPGGGEVPGEQTWTWCGWLCWVWRGEGSGSGEGTGRGGSGGGRGLRGWWRVC